MVNPGQKLQDSGHAMVGDCAIVCVYAGTIHRCYVIVRHATSETH
ncbi:hypothetical protein R8871_06043 [Paraburkholderia graminis C4D1M]|uniref:Uncharacterized protein n=1 Tax=Paraburkholderia graminis (strain ATCC 700544 / DSM 17151 / LMG 18924 / NCIMB 13744 / C4D1M) TaxID=396598 RepID=B1G488_PARG4|nr:hypothetical protein BgramDRAFT_4153 [Paraburkholderia graminis C4D1M]CAB3734329.1 hypothetical protein R8871_06043 [Paraburkholderia graminis C4D1M]